MSKQLCSVFSKRLILEHTRNQALWDWILEFEMPLHWKPAIVHSVSLARFRVRLNLAIRYYIATVCLFEVAAAAKIQPLWGRVEKTNKAELGNRLTYRVLIYYFSQLRIFEVETPIWKKDKMAIFILMVQGVSMQTCILYFAPAGRNMQASFGLKVVWEFWVVEFLLMALWFG